MNIPVNKNMDEFQDDIFKGLNQKQLIFGTLTVILGVAGFAFADLVCRVPQTLSFYVAVVFALPPAILGFLNIRGMPIPVYMRKRRQVLDAPLYIYSSGTKREQHQEEPVKFRKERRKKKQAPPQIFFDMLEDEAEKEVEE